VDVNGSENSRGTAAPDLLSSIAIQIQTWESPRRVAVPNANFVKNGKMNLQREG
jgi:hypothetical protein